MLRRPLIVIEHLEPELSRWLWIEYKHSARLARGRLVFTNVRRPEERRLLRRIAYATSLSVRELGCPPSKIIVLDPQAEEPLSPRDLESALMVVVGGILGDHPPRGRTRKLLTERLPGCLARNLGPWQLPIDGAVFVARRVIEGYTLDEIPLQVGVEIPLGEGASIELPYAYPLVDGRPLISRELVDYLKYEVEEDESIAVRAGRLPTALDPLPLARRLAALARRLRAALSPPRWRRVARSRWPSAG